MKGLIIILILVAVLLSYLLIKVWSLEDEICDLKVKYIADILNIKQEITRLKTNDEWFEYTEGLHKEIELLEKHVNTLYMRLDKLEDDGR